MEKIIFADVKKAIKASTGRLCPVCKGFMREVESCFENGFAYIWYECADNNCCGQWLEKRPA